LTISHEFYVEIFIVSFHLYSLCCKTLTEDVCVHCSYGVNVNTGQAGGNKLLTSYWLPAGKFPLNVVHLVWFLEE